MNEVVTSELISPLKFLLEGSLRYFGKLAGKGDYLMTMHVFDYSKDQI